MRSIGATLQNPAVSAQMTVFAFTTFAFAAVESSFSWLILIRFHDTLLNKVHHAWQLAHGTSIMPPALEKNALEAAQTGATTVVFGIVGITVLVTQLAMMGGLARKFGENRLVMFGTMLMAGCLLGIALAPNLQMIWLASCLLAIGNGVLNPCLSALITQSAGPNERGAISGAQQSLGSLARIVAPPINNSLVAMNTAIPFVSSAVLMGWGFCSRCACARCNRRCTRSISRPDRRQRTQNKSDLRRPSNGNNTDDKYVLTTRGVYLLSYG